MDDAVTAGQKGFDCAFMTLCGLYRPLCRFPEPSFRLSRGVAQRAKPWEAPFWLGCPLSLGAVQAVNIYRWRRVSFAVAAPADPEMVGVRS